MEAIETGERVGLPVSITMDKLEEAEDVLPAVSVCLALIEVWVLTERAEEVIVIVEEAQEPEPTEVTLSYKVTVVPVSQEIVKSGVVSLVILSESDVPESVATVMSGVPVIAWAVSIVTDKLAEAVDVLETLPCESVCLAFMEECVPSERVEEVMVTVEDEHDPVPTEVVLSYKVTVDPVSQEMVKSGVESLVMLSVLDMPESVAEVMSGVPGA